MAKKEIIIIIKDGDMDVQLGDGWPPGAEAANEAAPLLKGFAEITTKQHRPHHHQKESNKTEVTA